MYGSDGFLLMGIHSPSSPPPSWLFFFFFFCHSIPPLPACSLQVLLLPKLHAEGVPSVTYRIRGPRTTDPSSGQGQGPASIDEFRSVSYVKVRHTRGVTARFVV